MPETHCGPRIRDLGARLIDLQDRRTKLRRQLDAAAPATPSDEQLAAARQHIRDAIDNGDDPPPQTAPAGARCRDPRPTRQHRTRVLRTSRQQADTVRAPET